MLVPVPLAPEIRLHLADPDRGLFDLAGGEYHSDQPPPFWAFAWAGGQALARHLLDHPPVVAGRRVLDLATGSGLVAIAAARSGAAEVAVDDSDPAAVAAAHRNAAANGVTLVAAVDRPDVLLAGDAFYTARVAGQMTARLLRARRAGARVLVGEPGRGYFPDRLFVRLADYRVPVPAALEASETLLTSVWEMLSPHNQLYDAKISPSPEDRHA
ncbi:MAG TPA: 50S ribosomal protein L11 methyltransferase [Actinoplanes sp.]|nr:50S ribosomal protein L11 methyltransferase [Actinoplanes sp.]